jgi:hypothetical protein
MDNAHGFVYGHHLDTYKKSKSERVADSLKEKYDNRDDRRAAHKKRNRNTTHLSTTNENKSKQKAFSMLLPKKVLAKRWKDSDVRGKLKKRDKNAVG